MHQRLLALPPNFTVQVRKFGNPLAVFVNFDAARCRHRTEGLFDLSPVIHCSVKPGSGKRNRAAKSARRNCAGETAGRYSASNGNLPRKLAGKLLKEESRHADRGVLLIPFARNVFERYLKISALSASQRACVRPE